MPTLYDKHCKHCGKFFQVIPRKKKQQFCSSECARNINRNPNKLTHCLNCSGPLRKKTQFKFCSNSCSGEHSNKARTLTSRKKQRDSLIKTLTNNGTVRTNQKEIYYAECNFGKWSFEIWTSLPGFDLLKKHGMWHPINNPNGVVRDHIVSKSYGWANKIDPKVISHPANCRLISNYENIKKGAKSHISIEELLENIKNYKIVLYLKESRLNYLSDTEI